MFYDVFPPLSSYNLRQLNKLILWIMGNQASKLYNHGLRALAGFELADPFKCLLTHADFK
jgi:hypothetical protein